MYKEELRAEQVMEDHNASETEFTLETEIPTIYHNFVTF